MRAASVAKMAWMIAGVLAAGTASAAGGIKQPTAEGAKAGSTTTTTSEPSSGGESDVTVGALYGTRQADKSTTEAEQGEKAWDVNANALLSHVIDDYNPCPAGVPGPGNQIPSSGCGNNLAGQIYSIGVGYNLTQYDRIDANFNVSVNSIMDPGDDAVRAGNVAFGYTRSIPLPARLHMTIGGSFDLPTGYDAQRETEITNLYGRVGLSRRFGDLTLSGSGSFHYGFYKCAEQASLGSSGAAWFLGGNSNTSCNEPGGQMNQQWGTTFGLSANYTMPFYDALSIGASFTTSYYRLYQGGAATDSASGVSGDGATSNPESSPSGANPIEQQYGYSIFASYTVPEVVGIRSDFTIAYAAGDNPAGASTPLLQNGLVQPLAFMPYFYFKDNSSVYASLSVKY